VVLKNGLSTSEDVPGSSTPMVTRYYGKEAYGDLNGDGKADVAFLLSQEMDGSGTFFYVVVSIQTDDGYKGTNAVFLSDRIAPQSITIKNGMLMVNYADRNPGDPFTAALCVGETKYLQVHDNRLVEINP
jgi:hypothetical protein